jgi:hypothetical protein
MDVSGDPTGGVAGERDLAAVERRIDAFRQSIAPDLHSVPAYVPWDLLEPRLARLAPGIAKLQSLVDSHRLTKAELASALYDEPALLEVLQYLLASPHGAGFADGRELPASLPTTKKRIASTASVVIDLGLARLVPQTSRVEDLVRLAVLAVDSRRRGHRRLDTIEIRVRQALQLAIKDVTLPGAEVTRLAASRHPDVVRGRVRDVLAIEDNPVAAVATVFQAQSGGRQQRDLAITYPRLQENMDAVPMSLILIADGRGLLETPKRILERLFESVAACLTLQQAEGGGLAEALRSAVEDKGVRRTRHASALVLIDNALSRRTRLLASELPVAPDSAFLAMAQYRTENPDLGLTISDQPVSIEWVNKDWVQRAQELAKEFSPRQAVRLLSDALGLESVEEVQSPEDGLALVAGAPRGDRVLPPMLVISATRALPEESLVRAVARAAKESHADASLAALIAPKSPFWYPGTASLSVQRSLATSVVVVDPDQLVRVVGSSPPRAAFVKLVLQQADLTKANPFNSTGATPRRMFFGRVEEEATLRSMLRTNSAALTGGRRIGKTSLMHRLVDDLRDGDWRPFYADCQEAGSWSAFAALVGPRWDVDLPSTFAPSHLASMVRQLQRRAGGHIVVLLDEIDHLLKWDLNHAAGIVPEAFFRACRAISQEGTAQFVFSGERTVSERLWDASSPHWNFCKPLPIKQLTRSAADELLSVPLLEMGVQVDKLPLFLERAWEYSQGHPNIVQHLGDLLVQRLNARTADQRFSLSADDLAAVAATTGYKRHYCQTYWGQATPLEKAVSAMVAEGAHSRVELQVRLHDNDVVVTDDGLTSALRMLDLYGVLSQPDEPLVLRAAWYPEALQALGGPEGVITNQVSKLR